MINNDKWLDSIPKTDLKNKNDINQMDYSRWEKTISKKNTFNSVKKYSLMSFLFVCGLLLVSAVKNETRNLQKEINNLQTSVNGIKFNLSQAMLDNTVINSPENISKLAQEYLNTNLTTYKKSQIKNLNYKSQNLAEVTKVEKKETNEEKIKKFVKLKVAKKIEKKKTEIKKLKELYKDPDSIPEEVKIKIEEKKIEIKNIYNSPKDIFTLERVGRWAIVQVAKLFLGMPVVPGK
mgnify:CR=1 FL=1|tara:strand:+ start:2512 stop:3216 length:705 start_codon:yes stop_codon:yes gene_type:complete